MNLDNNEYRNMEGFDVIPRNSSNVTDNNYQCSDNYVISGNNVQKIDNSTMLDCKEKCLNDNNCIGFNYGTNTKECFLKKNANSFKKSPDCTFCIKKSLSSSKCGAKSNKLKNNNNSAFNELGYIFGEFDDESIPELSEDHLKTIIESKGKAIPVELQGKISKSEIENIVKSRRHLSKSERREQMDEFLKLRTEIMKIKGINAREFGQLMRSKKLRGNSGLKSYLESEEKSSDEVDEEEDDDDDEDEEAEAEVEEIAAENEVAKMLQENNMLNDNIRLKRQLQRKKRMAKKRRTKIYVDLKCFMNDMTVLQTHSEGIMVELPLLLSHMKSCAFIKKRKGNKARKERLENKLRNSGHKLSKAEKLELKSEIESTLSSKMRIPKPDVVKLGDDVETFSYDSDSDSDYYSDGNDGEDYYYDNEIDDDLFIESFSSLDSEGENSKLSQCSVKDYTWSWDFMTILKLVLLVLLLVLIFNKM